MKTELMVEADVVIRIRETGEEQNFTVKNIPCTWVWSEGSRDAMTYWAVSDWIAETFGNRIDWFSIKCVVSSPKVSYSDSNE